MYATCGRRSLESFIDLELFEWIDFDIIHVIFVTNFIIYKLGELVANKVIHVQNTERYKLPMNIDFKLFDVAYNKYYCSINAIHPANRLAIV